MHALWASLYRNVHFFEGEELEVNCSNFMNSERKIASDGSITIYVPRAFQRAAPHPLILPYVREARLLARQRISEPASGGFLNQPLATVISTWRKN